MLISPKHFFFLSSDIYTYICISCHCSATGFAVHLSSKPCSCSCLSFIVLSKTHHISPSFFCSFRPFQSPFHLLLLIIHLVEAFYRDSVSFWPRETLTLSCFFTSSFSGPFWHSLRPVQLLGLNCDYL